ncbi:hypothetical protein GPM19_10350 [Halomonas sp. ZH2S]|uniref:Uncharacterized protein n=1 Tax=Vreelandella zhuhanensis TaxID=2684210 RepID=A0A7X3H139_9GAMM|nr:hypothetical protein [Halomonas zhuhanensis]MWJ28601.1 hypothetical protein [Halomonas zhuhanensis]
MIDITLNNDGPMNLLPVKRIITEETSAHDRLIFKEGYHRILKARATLSYHAYPAGNLQAVVLTAVHDIAFDPMNLRMFKHGIHPLSTDNAGDYIRYVAALELAVETVIDDINDPTVTHTITPQEVFEGIVVDFSPCDQFDLEELGISPVNFLPREAWAD